jgi:hypothetical protein
MIYIVMKQNNQLCGTDYMHFYFFFTYQFMFNAFVHRLWEVKHTQLNKGMSAQFEERVRCLMATGTTSRQTREGLILNAAQFLVEDELEDYRSQIPRVEWFAKQREAVGVESYLYTFMRIAGCESIRQWGFDETKIDGVDTFNQWAMLIDPQAEGITYVLLLCHSRRIKSPCYICFVF